MTDQESQIVESKSAIQSTSAWGGLILIIPVVLQMMGTTLTGPEIADLQGSAASLNSIYLNLMMVIGTIQMIAGRINARQPIHFLPGGAFKIDRLTGKRLDPPIPADVAAAMVKTKTSLGAP